MEELIIIGAGPMGLYAAFAAGLRDLKGKVLESSYTYGGQVSALYAEKRIYDIPGFVNLTGQEFIDKLYLQYTKYQDAFPIYYNVEVTEIIKQKDHFLINTTKGSYQSKKVLIANGGGKFTPKKLDCENVYEQTNIMYTPGELEQYRNKDVVVLGGGDSAADWALMLADIARSVKLVHRRDAFRAHKSTIDEFVSKNGELVTPYVAKKVIGDHKIKKIVLEHVSDKSLKEVELDHVLVFYGVDKTINDLSDWGIEVDSKGIVVNTNMTTSVEGIFAVGNSVSYLGKLDMIVTGLGEVATAVSEIASELYPERKTNKLYSSLLIKE